jgi:ribonuclease P protein component
MLARNYRLRERRDFNRVYAKGRQFRSPQVSVYALARGREAPRFGISVSKKVGRAVQRNLVKRRLREACRDAIFGGAPALDYVLVARPSALEADFSLLKQTVQRLIKQAGGKEGSLWQGDRRRVNGDEFKGA